jgi:hypothetical protein
MRQNGTIATGYTPKHAKPASRKDAALGDLTKPTLGDRGKSAVNAPSVGRHAAVSAASSAAESRSRGSGSAVRPR